MKQCNILLVDDEPTQLKLIQHVLENKLGFRAIPLSSGREAVDYITSYRNPVPDVVLLDLSMPDMNGMEVIEALRPKHPNLPIIVLTIYGDIERAVAAIKAGATDFLAKPVAHERLRTSINNALKLNELANEVQRLKRTHQGSALFDDVIGSSKPLERVKQHAMRASESSIPVFLEGESGVGKELFARAIHGTSDRAEKPFVAVNCGAIPETLAESILFGHEKGAFTGANYKSLGRFREANGGTLFLDEISELPANIQVKLLRALQEGEVQPVGGKAEAVDVRIITACNRDLAEMVQQGKFREDLFYRLNIMPIQIPPLRERRDDIADLAQFFLKRFSALENKPFAKFSDEAIAMLESYRWPGNIRQLENAIFRLVVLTDEEVIEPEHLIELMPNSPNDVIGQTNGKHSLIRSRKLALVDNEGGMRRMRDIEQDIIYFALNFYDGKISEVARRLGIGRSTLYRKMHDYDINVS